MVATGKRRGWIHIGFIRVTWSVAKVVCDTNPGQTMRWDCYKTSSLILNFSLASSMFPLEALACIFSYPGEEGYGPIAVLRIDDVQVSPIANLPGLGKIEIRK